MRTDSKIDFTELNKLEEYLRKNQVPYNRLDDEWGGGFNRHQIIVYEDPEKVRYSWDVICHYGSYGYEDGLLEVMGTPVLRDDEDVCGYLTAENVIERYEESLKTYVFTFGSGHKNAGHYVKIKARDWDSARAKMFSYFGEEWAFQYSLDVWQDWIEDLKRMDALYLLETEIPLPETPETVSGEQPMAD